MTRHWASMGVREGGQGVIAERGGSEGITVTFIPRSSYLQAKGYLGRRWGGGAVGGVGAICDSGEAPTLIANRVGQHLRQLWKQIQGSGFILPAGLTSGPPLKSSSRCLGETNEK